MKFSFKKVYIILFLTLLFGNKVIGKEFEEQYTKENISNYFLGSISLSHDQNNLAFKHLKKAKILQNRHSEFNIKFLRTLVLLEKFDEALAFSKRVSTEEEFFFEADLLLGLDSFIKEDYLIAEKYFKRLNNISRYNLFFENFIGNILLTWSKASQNNKKDSFKFIKNIPNEYFHLTKIQEAFLQCYFRDNKTVITFKKLIENSDYNFSRYSFFLANYYLSKGENEKAKRIIDDNLKENRSNLLLKQTEDFFISEKTYKINSFFDCKNPKDSLSEFFYIIANLFSNEKNYQLSNFYLKISFLLNKKFTPNKSLLAENYFYQKKNIDAKKTYKSIKSIGPVYSWHASKNIARILLKEKGKTHSIKSLEKDFDLLAKANFEHYYELANFYSDNEYYKKSIKYYSLALDEINKEHFLVAKILDRRGISYERLNDWENAEADLLKSLEILPNQPNVMNYLAYTWIDKGINLDKGLIMLKKAVALTENDGYVIDSLGWAYYAKKNYIEAEQFLQRAVELLPADPIINDHYADALWMLNKNIQARYFWNYVLKLDHTEQKLKDTINKKLIFGLNKKL